MWVIEWGFTKLSIKRGKLFGRHANYPILTIRLGLVTVTSMNEKAGGLIIEAVRGLSEDPDWLHLNSKRAHDAIEDYRKQLYNSAEESAKRDAERAEARASKHEQENMQLRTENHTLRQAIRIVNES
ncbi:hypothetical protein [Vreelandella venusta]|uniref:hypothetical protein n=1 Tax=Vreelandella venusta TaxID=44935 RepID=UPI0018DAAC87|nr:hypothetical protein [Halomonas venusta]QPI62386.1 hypothetical protein IR195_10790 [Halomonas venusta]